MDWLCRIPLLVLSLIVLTLVIYVTPEECPLETAAGNQGTVAYNPKTKSPIKYAGKRLLYYSNSTATLQCLLLQAGDVSPNVGPTPSR